MKLNIGILSSGSLGYYCLQKISDEFKPQFIFTDKKSKEIIEFAENQNIPYFIGNPANGNAMAFINNFSVDLLLSINYLFIINQELLQYPRLYGINFHGSLLPKYRGRTPHVWAIINGEKETGITAHIMEEECDTGDIILQERFPIEKHHTGGDILEIYKEKYPIMIKTVLESVKKNQLVRVIQEENKATFFGKRAPEDGKINWEWHKERIYNWIRAQAFPYPGAYTYYQTEKITIDKISFSDQGFDSRMKNGLIIGNDPDLLVKTPNGVVRIEAIRDRSEILFLKNNIFI